MKMSRTFHRRITETQFGSQTIKTVYFARKIPRLQLYILCLYNDQSAGLDNSDSNVEHEGYEFGDDDLEEAIRKGIDFEGYHEISEEEFMRYVDELFPRWRELKFNKKTKEMYYPEEVQ